MLVEVVHVSATARSAPSRGARDSKDALEHVDVDRARNAEVVDQRHCEARKKRSANAAGEKSSGRELTVDNVLAQPNTTGVRADGNVELCRHEQDSEDLVDSS